MTQCQGHNSVYIQRGMSLCTVVLYKPWLCWTVVVKKCNQERTCVAAEMIETDLTCVKLRWGKPAKRSEHWLGQWNTLPGGCALTHLHYLLRVDCLGIPPRFPVLSFTGLGLDLNATFMTLGIFQHMLIIRGFMSISCQAITLYRRSVDYTLQLNLFG